MSGCICDNPRCEFHLPTRRGYEGAPVVSVQGGPKWVTHTSTDGQQRSAQLGYEILHVHRHLWRNPNDLYADRYLCESCHRHALINGFDSL